MGCLPIRKDGQLLEKPQFLVQSANQYALNVCCNTLIKLLFLHYAVIRNVHELQKICRYCALYLRIFLLILIKQPSRMRPQKNSQCSKLILIKKCISRQTKLIYFLMTVNNDVNFITICTYMYIYVQHDFEIICNKKIKANQ